MNHSSETIYDLIVIGGGAAGFFAAISCAERSSSPQRILILEKGPEVLQKVKISGGGRCNVTHDLHDPREFAEYYPRGRKTLPGPLYQWNAADMIDWLQNRGIELKTEADGRMFPTSDRSETIIECFLKEARENGIEIRSRTEVTGVDFEKEFTISLQSGETLHSTRVLVATGGIRSRAGADIAAKFGHHIEPAAPSLFTFKIQDARIHDLAGISVPLATASVSGTKLRESGPILITHWGLSGPGILKLSAQGARELQQRNYQFQIRISWVGNRTREEISAELASIRDEFSRQNVQSHGHFEIPARLWKRLCDAAGIEPDRKWGNLEKVANEALIEQLTAGRFSVNGKSMNKDEFVTCGGVSLKEIDFKTMQSRLQPGLYFAGEVLDIDGVTGGFNFQSAWTTGRIAGEALAGWLSRRPN